MTFQKALEEDPTIYQFDEIYDDMKAQKNKADTVDAGDGPKEKPKVSNDFVRFFYKDSSEAFLSNSNLLFE
jgi:coiled-coil domain-containing protein 55